MSDPLSEREDKLLCIGVARKLVDNVNGGLERFEPDSPEYRHSAAWSSHIVNIALRLYEAAAREGRAVGPEDLDTKGNRNISHTTREVGRCVFARLNLTEGTRRWLKGLALPDPIAIPDFVIVDVVGMVNGVLENVKKLDRATGDRLLTTQI